MLDNRLTDTTRSGQAADFHRFPLTELDKNGQNRTNRFHVVGCCRLQHAPVPCATPFPGQSGKPRPAARNRRRSRAISGSWGPCTGRYPRTTPLHHYRQTTATAIGSAPLPARSSRGRYGYPPRLPLPFVPALDIGRKSIAGSYGQPVCIQLDANSDGGAQ